MIALPLFAEQPFNVTLPLPLSLSMCVRMCVCLCLSQGLHVVQGQQAQHLGVGISLGNPTYKFPIVARTLAPACVPLWWPMPETNLMARRVPWCHGHTMQQCSRTACCDRPSSCTAEGTALMLKTGCRLDTAISKMLASDSYAQAAQHVSVLMRATRLTPAEKGASTPDALCWLHILRTLHAMLWQPGLSRWVAPALCC